MRREKRRDDLKECVCTFKVLRDEKNSIIIVSVNVQKYYEVLLFYFLVFYFVWLVLLYSLE